MVEAPSNAVYNPSYCENFLSERTSKGSPQLLRHQFRPATRNHFPERGSIFPTERALSSNGVWRDTFETESSVCERENSDVLQTLEGRNRNRRRIVTEARTEGKISTASNVRRRRADFEPFSAVARSVTHQGV